MTPPRIRFLTRIYHPNIDRLGRICLDVLKNNWSPALQIRTILLSIQALLGAPNPEDPLNEAVAKQWKVGITDEDRWCMEERNGNADNYDRRIRLRRSRMHENGLSCMRSRRSEECASNHEKQFRDFETGSKKRTRACNRTKTLCVSSIRKPFASCR